MNGELETYKYPGKKMNRTLSVSSTASDSSNSEESDSGDLSSPREETRKNRTWRQFSVPDMTEKAVVPPVKAVSGAATIRKRLYASVPGKRFVAIKDYRPFMAGELALEKGDEVEGNVALLIFFFYGLNFKDKVLYLVRFMHTETRLFVEISGCEIRTCFEFLDW